MSKVHKIREALAKLDAGDDMDAALEQQERAVALVEAIA
jgi:hypothetical protein